MKFKSILTLIFSTLLLAGCSEDQVLGTFGDLNLSTTYISIPAEGGAVNVTLNAGEAWEFSAEKDFAIPEWITVSQTSGEAGKTELTFSAEASNLGREAEMKIVAGSKSQFLKVRQGEMTASPATCKQVNEAPDGKNFVVSGTITKIENTTYGNWYMNDGTADLYIYGTLDAEGKTKNFASLGLEVGDKVTIEGPKSTYKEKAQMVDVTVKKIEKALLKVVTPSEEISKEGGVLEVKLASKGKAAFYEISEECQEWISYENAEYIEGVSTKLEPNPADTVVYTFNIQANDASAREGSISFYANEGEPIPYTFTQEDGTPFKILSESVKLGKNENLLKVVIATNSPELSYRIAEENKEWISYSYTETINGVVTDQEPNPADTIVYTFNVSVNEGNSREGSISFYVREDHLVPYTFIQLGGIADVTVAEFLAAEVNDAAQYRIVGHVIKIDTKYNNNFYVKDYTGEVYAYYVDTQGHTLAIGDFVTVVGTRSEYNGTPQLPKGTLLEKYTATPEVSVAEFLTKEDATDVYYKLTGTITNIANPTYGNMTLQDANGDDVFVYGILPGYGATGDAKKGMVEEKGLKVGDTITIVGNKASHNGSPQVGNAVYMSHTSN